MAPSVQTPGERRATLRIGAGPRATEEALLTDVCVALDELGPELLSRPLRLVVPSRALRRHLLGRLVVRRGRALAGFHCTTLFGLARSVAERIHGAPNLHDELGRLFARRFARSEEWLERSLDHLKDGYRAVDASVRDLLEAGLDPAHVEALEEALAVDGRAAEASESEIERARALVRVAGRTLEALDEVGVLTTSTLLRAATEILHDDPHTNLPTSALFVYGFSDAIGVATDLLTVLLDRFDGTAYLDQPDDPSAPARPDASNVFSRRFRERIGDVAQPREDVPGSPPATVDSIQAIGVEAEAREVAARIRALLDRGIPPEGLAIVARRVDTYRSALRIHLGRLGVPFSALAASGPQAPEGRTVQALLTLLERRGATPVERWLDARARPIPQIANADLYLALSTIGAGRLEEVPGRPYSAVSRKGRYQLPVRRGFQTDEDQEVYAQRRHVPLTALEAAAAAARSVLDLLDDWRSESHLGGHGHRFRQLLSDQLSWSAADDLTRRVTSVVDELQRGLRTDLHLTFDEFVEMVRKALDRVGESPLGGRGGGVQVLDVIEARGMTFEHLFLVGLNRGVFPRVVNEDSLLPDPLRSVLSRHGFGVLQDLPQKLSGYDEERYLFSQLIASAANVTLSWLDVDEDNHQQSPSPLVERLRWSGTAQTKGLEQPATARHLYSEQSARLEAPGWLHRPAHEAAVVAGIYGDRTHFGKMLGLAVERSSRESSLPAAARGVHTARLRILDEVDPVRGSAPGERAWQRLGPYFGYLGAPGPGDPRRRERLFITTLESMSACSWRAFLERLLQLRPIPDPLEALPAVEPLYIGNLVHRVLERLVAAQLRHRDLDLESARDSPTPVLWPDDEEVAALLREEADALVRSEGFAFPGFARLMAEVVGPYLETARALEWQEGPVQAAATEIYGSLLLAYGAGSSREISFKADRVDAIEGVRLTDYKTGRPLSLKKTAAARRKDLLEKVRSGETLQAVAYALAGGEPADSGRYAYLKPDPQVSAEQRTAEVTASDTELIEAFERAAQAALVAWDRGAFLPRLIEGRGEKEFRFCGSCRVAEACLRGDSGSRIRLREWVDTSASARTGDEPLAEAALEVWNLRSRQGEERRGGYRK